METGKIIAREVAPDCVDFSFYFDDDGFSSRAGDQCYSVFVPGDRWHDGYNMDEYRAIQGDIDNILDEYRGYGTNTMTIAIEYALGLTDAKEITRNTRKLHKLKNWAKDADSSRTETVAEYLTILTGKNWDSRGFCGYSQGDYCEVVYCTETYNDDAITEFGKLWLGCGSEFTIDDVGGYFVVDTLRWAEDETLVKALADMHGCDSEELKVLLYDGEQHIAKYRTLEIA